MDTNFNAALYQEEMLSLVNTAIKKLKAEHPDYTVFTISLTTDFASGVSAVHFDSRASSERYLKNEAEQYQKYLQAGNLSMAEMYAPTGEIRITNPADFELPFYADLSAAIQLCQYLVQAHKGLLQRIFLLLSYAFLRRTCRLFHPAQTLPPSVPGVSFSFPFTSTHSLPSFKVTVRRSPSCTASSESTAFPVSSDTKA